MRIKTKLPFPLPLLLIIAICFALGSEAGANAGIPGPLIVAGGSVTENPLQWIAANMFMCIGIEGAIYRYLKLFAHPFLASAYANTVSLIAGLIAGLLLAFVVDAVYPTIVLFPTVTLVFIPTVLSVFVEWLVLKRFQRPGPAGDAPAIQRSVFWPVVWANIVTNFITAGYLTWIVGLGLI